LLGNIDKLKEITNWMCNDISRSIFSAKANFLVALGLMNYTEILGSFITGEFQKDNSDTIKLNQKAEHIKTTSTERFNSFFRRLGDSYKELIDIKKLKVYDELRCGLTHEYLVKKKQFCIYGTDSFLNEQEMNSLPNPISPKSIAHSGVIYQVDPSGNETWHILNPKYYIDFKRAKEKLISEIESGSNKTLISNFQERCRYVNLARFISYSRLTNTSGAFSQFLGLVPS